MLETFLLDTCALGGGTGMLQQSWVQISVLILLVAFVLAGAIFTIGNFLTITFREKFKQIAKLEAVQAVIGFAIILGILAFSELTCNIGTSVSHQLVGTSLTPLNYSQYYIANLLFSTGFGLVGNFYATGIQYTSFSIVINELSDTVGNPIGAGLYGLISTGPLGKIIGGIPGVGLAPGENLAALYSAYATLFSGVFTDLVILSFASLLLVFLLLPAVQYAALVVAVPVAIIMRLLPFAGPRLRSSADSILALGLAFYFVLPLTIVMNGYIISWSYCTGALSQASGSCNPYSAYLGPYTENNFLTNTFLQGNDVQLNAGFLNLFGLGGGFKALTNIFAGGPVVLSGFNFFQIINAPTLATKYSTQVAQYVFQSTILLAVDYTITIAFAIGLSKAFNSIGSVFVSGRFWE